MKRDKAMQGTWISDHQFDYKRTPSLYVKPKVREKSDTKMSLDLISRLQQSMEPETLLAIFREEVSKFLPVCGLTFRCDKEVFTVAMSGTSKCSLEVGLRVKGDTIGRIEYDFTQTLILEQKHQLSQLTQLLSYPLRNALEFRQMKHLALNDSLTGLANRNQFNLSFKDSVTESQKKQVSFSLLVLDLDGFKRINDEFGHQTGDLVLTTFAQILVDCCRDGDQVFRFGGDEFTVLLNNADKKSARYLSDRIYDAVLSNNLLVQFKVSCSIGTARYQLGDSFNSLFERADLALYRAKSNGKNCLELSPCAE